MTAVTTGISDQWVAGTQSLARPPSTGPTGILSRSRLLPIPFHPLLLAAYPILLLFAENQAEVGVRELVEPGHEA